MSIYSLYSILFFIPSKMECYKSSQRLCTHSTDKQTSGRKSNVTDKQGEEHHSSSPCFFVSDRYFRSVSFGCSPCFPYLRITISIKKNLVTWLGISQFMCIDR